MELRGRGDPWPVGYVAHLRRMLRGGGELSTENSAGYETIIEGGKHWSFNVGGGTLLRLTDLEGGANAGMLFYNPQNTLERYNAPDTLKCQHTFKLTKGHCL